MDQLSAHRRAQEVFGKVLAGVTPDQLDAPTPCADWTVRDLVAHVIVGDRRVAGNAASGNESATADLAPADLSTADLSTADLSTAHAESAAAAQAVFAAPDGLTRTFEVPFGAVPGAVYIGLRTTDALTHAWDLARATGQATDLDAELAAEMLLMSRERMGPAFRGPGRPFAEECAAAGRPVRRPVGGVLGRQVS